MTKEQCDNQNVQDVAALQQTAHAISTEISRLQERLEKLTGEIQARETMTNEQKPKA